MKFWLFKAKWISKIIFRNGLTEKIIQIGGIIPINAFKDLNGQAPDSVHW